MSTQHIKINQLVKSPLNVRRTVSKGALNELKASIMAHGLMQNLTVTDAKDGTFHVIAGGQRLAALQALIAEGKLPQDHLVACNVVSDSNAIELSIAENTVRHAMHPADEFEAFAALADTHSAAEIAQRFGVDEKHVLKRMKLARVHPELLKEYRAEKLSLECLMAFTVSDDQKRQMKVYKSLSSWQRNHADHIRGCFTEKMVGHDHKLAMFVGLDAYKAAGGKVREDLFGEDTYLEDPALLTKLATKKMEDAVTKLEKEGWGWIEAAWDRDWSFRNNCMQMDRLPTKKEEKALAGCYVVLSREGKLDIDKGLVKRADQKKLAAARGEKVPEKKAKPKDHMPDSLRRDLEGYRLQVAQVAIAEHRGIAFDLLVFTVACERLDDKRYYGLSGPDVAFKPHDPTPFVTKDKTAAGEKLKAIRAALPLDWLKAKKQLDQFEQFRQLTMEQKLDILAYCTATTLQPQLGNEPDARDCAYEAALGLTGVDVAAYWRPTKDNFLSRINREQNLDIGKAVFGKPWEQSHRGSKKSTMVEALDKSFANPENHHEQIAATLKALLPAGMAFKAPVEEKPVKLPRAKSRKAA